jgi:hypothetical protein
VEQQVQDSSYSFENLVDDWSEADVVPVVPDFKIKEEVNKQNREESKSE